MEQADRTNYEQEHPRHQTELEFLDRTREALDRALRNIAEAEERMASNVKRTRDATRPENR